MKLAGADRVDRIGAGVGIPATPDGDIPRLTLEDSPAAERGTEALLARVAVSALRSMSRHPPVNPIGPRAVYEKYREE
jgi:hypothetical protein